MSQDVPWQLPGLHQQHSHPQTEGRDHPSTQSPASSWVCNEKQTLIILGGPSGWSGWEQCLWRCQEAGLVAEPLPLSRPRTSAFLSRRGNSGQETLEVQADPSSSEVKHDAGSLGCHHPCRSFKKKPKKSDPHLTML